jgi:hypothetical protein
LIKSAGDFFRDRSLSGDFFIRFNFVYPGAYPTPSRFFAGASSVFEVTCYTGDINFSFGKVQAQGLLFDLTVAAVGSWACYLAMGGLASEVVAALTNFLPIKAFLAFCNTSIYIFYPS